MKRLHGVLATILLGVCAPAWADGGGTVYREGAATKFLSAYAYAKPDLFDESKQAVVIYMLDGPIDAATFDAAPDREGALHHLLWDTDGHTVQLTIGPDKNGQARVEQVNLYAKVNGKMESTSTSMGPDYYTLDLKVNDGKRIEGSLVSTHESEKTKKNGGFYDLHFALDVVSGPPFGPGLPPEGGEVFKAYKAYARALESALWALRNDWDQEKYQAVINTLSDARIKGLHQIAKNAGKSGAEEKIKAELKKMLASVPYLNSNDYKFVSGRLKGDVATMEIRGKGRSADGSEMADSEVAITVTMKKEKGEWFFDKDQKHETGGSKAAPAETGKAKSGT